jgi:hypothetical protein
MLLVPMAGLDGAAFDRAFGCAASVAAFAEGNRAALPGLAAVLREASR